MAKMKEGSKEYDTAAANLALSLVTIKACLHCGYPVVDGYCCTNCNSDNPTNRDQNCSIIEIEYNELLAGDYVLATKYSDGDPQDQWCVGFFDSILPKKSGIRFQVVDGNGKLFRKNGFRKVMKISKNEGQWLLEHVREIETSGRSLWEWLDQLSL